MKDDEIKKKKKWALRLTWICAISLLIGGSWAWLMIIGGGPEALGAILPLLLVGGIHLFAGPVAIYQAYRTHGHFKSYLVYAYFGLFLSTTVWLFPPDILTYVVLFVLLTIVPILSSLIAGLLKNATDNSV